MKRFPFASCVVLFLTVGLSAFAEDHSQHQHSHATPGINSLDVYTDGPHVHLLIGERDGTHPIALKYLRSDDSGATWSQPVSVDAGQPPAEPAHRGADAQIAAFGNDIVAIWTTAGDDKMGRGPMAVALSHDGGKTWSKGIDPSDDHASGGHAFLDIATDHQGTFHLVWLDTREGTAKGLRYSRSTDAGRTWLSNVTLAAVTCECCWNTIAISPENHVSVLYRSHHPRDMSVITSSDAGKTWGNPTTVGVFGWQINACPHVGGGLTYASPTTLIASVWTAKDENTHGAFTLRSDDSGHHFSSPSQLGNNQSWHTDLASDGHGNVVAIWDAYVDNAQAVYLSRSSDNGITWSPAQRLSDPPYSADHPRVTSTPGGFRAFWTQHQGENPSEWVERTL